MLEFQLAMLADESLVGDRFRRDRRGLPADKAWSDALAGEIAGYEAADDEYFRRAPPTSRTFASRCSMS